MAYGSFLLKTAVCASVSPPKLWFQMCLNVYTYINITIKVRIIECLLSDNYKQMDFHRLSTLNIHIPVSLTYWHIVTINILTFFYMRKFKISNLILWHNLYVKCCVSYPGLSDARMYVLNIHLHINIKLHCVAQCKLDSTSYGLNSKKHIFLRVYYLSYLQTSYYQCYVIV